MNNKYLEKAASKWATRASHTAQGQALGLTPGQSGTGGIQLIGAGRKTNADLLASIGSAKPSGKVLEGGGSKVMQTGFGGLGRTKQVGFNANTAVRSTGDALGASGNNRILNKATRIAEKKNTLVSKALGFAKKNPAIAAGGVLAAGLAARSVLSKKQEPQYYQGYQ